jgi:hypothetical protein
MATQQITMYRTEVPLNRTFDRYYQGDYNEMEEQLLAIKSEVDQLLFYFESQHQMGLAAASKGAPWDARTGPAVARGAGLAFLDLPRGARRAHQRLLQRLEQTDAELTSVGS